MELKREIDIDFLKTIQHVYSLYKNPLKKWASKIGSRCKILVLRKLTLLCEINYIVVFYSKLHYILFYISFYSLTTTKKDL